MHLIRTLFASATFSLRAPRRSCHSSQSGALRNVNVKHVGAYICKSEGPEGGVEVCQWLILRYTLSSMDLDCSIDHPQCHLRYCELPGISILSYLIIILYQGWDADLG